MKYMYDFQAFISSLGFEPPARIEPGRFARFSTNGKRGDDAGWALLFPDGEGGVVGDFRSGEKHVWQAGVAADPTPENVYRRQQQIEEAKRAAEAARQQGYEEAAKRAAEIWALAQLAPGDHSYLVKKGVSLYGVRIYRGDLVIGGMKCDGALVIPARTSDGALRSLQFIDAAGEKRYLPRGEILGNFFMLGTPGPSICIAEGFATAASVHEATGDPVAVAFDAGNLMPVAERLRATHPTARIVICGDNDGNKRGQQEAQAAAQAVDGFIVIPAETGTDWNDLLREKGAEAVKGCIEAARPVEPEAHDSPGSA